MKSPQIDIIGLGVAEQASLTPEASEALQQAQWIIGSERQWQTLSQRELSGRFLPLPKLSELKPQIDGLAAQHVAILASGDPLHFGIGAWFARHFPRENLQFFPGISSIQACCHAMGLSQQAVKVVSVHGRPLHTLVRQLPRHRHILCLTDGNSHPAAIAKLCRDMGYEASRFTVCEDLGYRSERIQTLSLSECLAQPKDAYSPLHVTLIEVRGRGGVLPSFPGIDDTQFVTDKTPGEGMFTKREVRLNILSLLQLAPEEVLWDIGAGCGGVAVESAFWAATSKIIAIEKHPERLACLYANRDKFGVGDNLRIVEGHAPEALSDLPTPHKIFIGGSGGHLSDILQSAWQQLPRGGVLVASSVTEASAAQLNDFIHRVSSAHSKQIRLSVAFSESDGDALREKKPVTLFQLIKAQ